MSGKATINSFDLDPEWGDVDLLEHIEEAFDLEIGRRDGLRITTFGDLFDLVCRKLGDPVTPRACFSAHIFYRLRSVFKEVGLPCTASPSEKLQQLVPHKGEKVFWDNAERQTDFHIPYRMLGELSSVWPVYSVMMAAVFAAISGVFAFNEPTPMTVSLFVASIILASLLCGYIIIRLAQSRRSSSLRDLTQFVLDWNFGKLVRELGGYRKQEVWNTLISITNRHADRPLALSDVEHETVFFDNVLVKRNKVTTSFADSCN